ncbi:hypothetical protein THAOC_12656, partial [Thalassiosira oceanica]
MGFAEFQRIKADTREAEGTEGDIDRPEIEVETEVEEGGQPSVTMFASSVRRTALTACRRAAASNTGAVGATRSMAKMPFGLDKILGEPDNLIPTDQMRKTKKGYIPEFAPDDLKKEMADLGI